MGILEELEREFQEGNVAERLEGFLVKHVDGFEGKAGEQSHADYEVYMEFARFMEDILEDFMRATGFEDLEEFYATVKDEASAEEENGVDLAKSFLQAILSAFEYESFVTLMTTYREEIESGDQPEMSDKAGVSDAVHFFTNPKDKAVMDEVFDF